MVRLTTIYSFLIRSALLASLHTLERSLSAVNTSFPLSTN